MNKIKLGLAIGAIGVIFSGCGTTLSTAVYPQKNYDNRSHIQVSQDSASSLFGMGSVKRTNLKYAFGAAATEAKNKGYQYFSILIPHRIKDVYVRRNVKTVDEAFNVCDQGEDAFQTNVIGASSGEKCDSFIMSYGGNNGIGNGVFPVFMDIEYHNEDRKDNFTFNADEVLKSDLLKGLSPDYFKTMSR